MRRLWLILGFFSATPLGAHAAAVRVPSEYATINEGIDAASAGDTVLVAPGIYPDFEVRTVLGGAQISACAFVKDGIVLRSEGGSSVTSIDRMGVDTPEPAITIRADALTGAGTIVEGFRITGNPVGHTAVVCREYATSAELLFRDCVFEDLDGGSSTGAIRAIRANLRFENCVFRRCTGGIGGIHFDEGNLTILDTLFEECVGTGAGSGAGQATTPSTTIPYTTCEVRRCTFLRNEGYSPGGLSVGIFRAGSWVEDCYFEGNLAQNSGGALSLGGDSEHFVRRNVFVDNGADGSGPHRLGGAMWCGGVAEITENTFVGSYQGNDALGGATMYIAAASVISRNVIVDSIGSEAIGKSIIVDELTTECNVFWNNAEGEGITLDPTDLVADPQFCDASTGDYTLSSTSPCLPEINPSCTETIGALGVGCGLVSIAPMSWGRIKGLYQPNEE
jgi:hypothetical protein